LLVILSSGVQLLLLLCAVDLVSANLSKLNVLIWEAQPKWFYLGLELGISEARLRTIEVDFHTVERRFTEVLSLWLKMNSPQRSWERLVTALKLPTVGFSYLARNIEERFGMVPEGATAATATTDGAAGQYYQGCIDPPKAGRGHVTLIQPAQREKC
jgi:hypothetical protein